MSVPEIVLDDFQQRCVGFYLGWQAFQAANQPSQTPIIDINLIKSVGVPTEFTTIRHVHDAAGRLHAEAGYTAMLDKQFVAAMLSGSVMFTAVQAGEEADFPDYVEATMGFRPERVDETHIDQQVAAIDQTKTAAALPDHMLVDSDNLEVAFQAETERGNRLLAHYVKLETTAAVPLRVEPSDDSYTAAFTGDENGEPVILINPNATGPAYHLGNVAGLAIEESVSHGNTAQSLQTRIRNGLVNPIAGIITYHTVASTYFEFSAQLTKQLLLPQNPQQETNASSELDALRRLEALQDDTRLKVYHNAHIDINSGTPEAEVVAYVKERLPDEPPDYVVGSVKARRDNPVVRTNFTNYQLGFRAVAPFLELGLNNKRRIMQTLYTTPLSPAQLATLV